MAFWVLGERMRVFPYEPLVQAQVNPKYPLVVGDGCEVAFEARIEVVPVGESVLLPKRWSALRVTHPLQLWGLAISEFLLSRRTFRSSATLV